MKALKIVVSPLVWWAFFLLLGGVVGLNWPCGLLAFATLIHLISN